MNARIDPPLDTPAHACMPARSSSRGWYEALCRCAWIALVCGLAHLSAIAADWPQWRGANRDAVWTESGIVDGLPASGPKVLWRTPVGMGFSSPVIVGGKVYLSDAELTKPIIRDRVHCLSADTGKVLWTHSFEITGPDWLFTEEQARGPGATPIVRGGKIYAVDLFGNLVCLETSHGNLVWKRNLPEDYQLPGTSVDTSPLIEGNLLILMLGGKGGAGVVALDRNTGREVWRSLTERVTWSSPIVIQAGGSRQLIVWTQQSVSSLDPANGSIYWREATSTGGSPGTAGVSTPVASGNLLLVGGWMFQLEADRLGARTLWPEGKGVARRILSDTSSGLISGDHVYTAKTGGAFACLKASTGEELWQTNTLTAPGNGASIHLTQHGDRTFLFNDRGELIQARLTPDGYHELSRTKLIEPTWPFAGRKVAWAPPAFARRNIYARNDKEIVCVSLAANAYGNEHRSR